MDPFTTKTNLTHSNHNFSFKAFIIPDCSCGKSKLTLHSISKVTTNPQSLQEAVRWDTNQAKHPLRSRWLQAAVFMTGKTWFQYQMFPNKKPAAPLDKDFLSNKTINFVGRGILLLIQYMNLWSAVWAVRNLV